MNDFCVKIGDLKQTTKYLLAKKQGLGLLLRNIIKYLNIDFEAGLKPDPTLSKEHRKMLVASHKRIQLNTRQHCIVLSEKPRFHFQLGQIRKFSIIKPPL